MKVINFEIVGTQPLMLHNSQTVNPFNKYAIALKPLTSKRKKTEDDLNEIFKLQFEASLYMDGNTYIIPSDHFWKSVTSAAKEVKLGKKFEQSFLVTSDCVLDFPEKDMSPEELFNEKSHVDIRDAVIKQSRVTTCRSIFPQWKTTVECLYDESQIDEKDVISILNVAGMRYGVGTYRKKYGRFSAKKI